MKEFIKRYRLILGGLTLLLALTLGARFYVAHKALRKEAMNDAEQTLESTAQSKGQRSARRRRNPCSSALLSLNLHIGLS